MTEQDEEPCERCQFLLAALEQAVMDMEAFRLAMEKHDRQFFAPCVERAKAAAAVVREGS